MTSRNGDECGSSAAQVTMNSSAAGSRSRVLKGDGSIALNSWRSSRTRMSMTSPSGGTAGGLITRHDSIPHDGCQPRFSLRAARQALEARVSAERGERRIESKPAGREIVRDLEQRLEMIERPLGLAEQDMDPGELMLRVWPVLGVAADGEEVAAAFPRANRVGPAPQIGQCHAERRMRLGIVRLLHGLPLQG